MSLKPYTAKLLEITLSVFSAMVEFGIAFIRMYKKTYYE
jgi:hypothetical protein